MAVSFRSGCKVTPPLPVNGDNNTKASAHRNIW